MSSRSQVFIADLLFSLRALEIDSEKTARTVMKMLGLEVWHEVMSADFNPERPGRIEPAPQPRPIEEPMASTDQETARAIDTSASGPISGDTLGEVVIRRAGTRVMVQPPAWAQAVEPLRRAVRAESPPPAPLFDPRQERALLNGLASSLVRGTAVDLERLIEEFARGTPPRDLPMRAEWGTRKGLQVLVDDGPGMAPFRADVAYLQARLSDLLPADRLQCLSFAGCPMRNCRTPGIRGRHAWKRPEPGSAVLLVSELGIAQLDEPSESGGIEDWLAFADAARTARVQVRTLIPYPADRWPTALVHRLHPVVWDRRSTVAMVRRAVSASANDRCA